MEGVNYLEMVPVRCVDCEQSDDPPRVVILMPRFRDPVFGRLLQPHLKGDRRFIRVPLDKRGSVLWPQIDGRRTVGELVILLREAFPDDDEQLEERLCQYVAAMVGHGYLHIRLP